MKKHYRFGMEYFGNKKPWIVVDAKNAEGGVAPAYMVMRDHFSEWKVSDLWNLYMAPKETSNE